MPIVEKKLYGEFILQYLDAQDVKIKWRYKMPYAITSLKCKKGHTLPIYLDGNKYGCHHGGKPIIVITCRDCLEEWKKDNYERLDKIEITLERDEFERLKREVFKK